MKRVMPSSARASRIFSVSCSTVPIRSALVPAGGVERRAVDDEAAAVVGVRVQVEPVVVKDVGRVLFGDGGVEVRGDSDLERLGMAAGGLAGGAVDVDGAAAFASVPPM
jgi:hypothetical protein